MTFACDPCDKSFPSLQSLGSHARWCPHRGYESQRRWPYRPLQRFLGPCRQSWHQSSSWKTTSTERPMTNQLVADILGVSERTVARWAKDGLSDRLADEVAVKLNVHPFVIWPAWFDLESVA